MFADFLQTQRLAVTSARLKGLEQDLGLNGEMCLVETFDTIVICLTMLVDIQYSTVLAIVYASYIPANVPSNMVSLFQSMSMRSLSSASQILNQIARYASSVPAG